MRQVDARKKTSEYFPALKQWADVPPPISFCYPHAMPDEKSAYLGQIAGVRMLADGDWTVTISLPSESGPPIGLMELGATVAIARVKHDRS